MRGFCARHSGPDSGPATVFGTNPGRFSRICSQRRCLLPPGLFAVHVLGSQRQFQSSTVYRGFRLYRLRRVRNRQLGRTRNRMWDRPPEGAQEPLPALEIAVVAVKGGQVVPSPDHPSGLRFPGTIKDFSVAFRSLRAQL
jgi:hypothetical protein